MTVNAIPFQQIATQLKITATPVDADSKLNFSLAELIEKNHCNLGTLEDIPRAPMDLIISFLDTATAFYLKITCAAFRALVRENLQQEARYTLRFFDLASYQMVEESNELNGRDMGMWDLTKPIAQRGDFSTALRNVATVEDEPIRMLVYSHIALMQAFRGDLTGAKESLNRIESQPMRECVYEDVVKKLAKCGDDANAITMADTNGMLERCKLTAYKYIIRSQFSRRDEAKAFGTVEAIDQSVLGMMKPKLYVELAILQAKHGNRAGAKKTVDALVNQADKDKANKGIVKALIKVDTLPKKKALKPRPQKKFISLIKQGNFKEALERMNKIAYISSRAKAYQQAVTVLYEMISSD
ncbi:MAG: hypothetical protein ACK5MA_04700 [Parachlamydiaceae bacterium]